MDPSHPPATLQARLEALTRPEPGRVVVAGGGLIGLAVAWRLAQAGRPVVLVERDALGQGASRAAAGMLAPIAEVEFVERALLGLKRDSLSRYPAFVAELEAASGLKVDYRDEGTLVVAIDRDDTEDLHRLFAYQERLGLPVAWLSGDQARQREPLLAPSIQAAVAAASDHQVDPLKLVRALTVAAERAGVALLPHTTLTRIEHAAGAVAGVVVRATEGDDAQRGVFAPAETVVVATGAWSRMIEGLPGPQRPPVRPVKGQLITLRMPDPQRPVLTHVVRAPDCYLVPRHDGRLIVGATSEDRGFDHDLTAGGLFDLLRGAYETLPITYELAFEGARLGFRPAALDNEPILGRTDALDGLVFATGHYRNGVLLTPITADLIRDAIVHDTQPPQLAPFALARFDD